jgi:hypothetical protein
MMETGTVQLQTFGADTITGHLSGWEFVQWITHPGGIEGPGITCQDVPYRFGTGTVNSTFRNGILTIEARATIGMTSTSGLETIAIQSNTLTFRTRTSRWIVVQFTNLQRCGTK